MDSTRTKACASCHRLLPFSDFYRRGASKDAKQHICKACSSKQAAIRWKRGEPRRRNREVAMDGTKRCAECLEEKTVLAFYVCRAAPGGRQGYCKKCTNEKSKIRNQQPRLRDQRRWYDLKRDLGLTREDYETLLQRQNGSCAICGKRGGERRLSVDHSHRTGFIRGLLCDRCNRGVGFFDEDPDRLRAAADYLGRSIGSTCAVGRQAAIRASSAK